MATQSPNPAILAFFLAAWADRTPVGIENTLPNPWPPMTPDVELAPWVSIEITGSASSLEGGSGVEGNRLFRDDGLITVHSWVPTGSGETLGEELARQAGDIFRAKAFFESPDGRRVRTLAPFPPESGSKSDDGNYFGSTMTVEYSYWYRG